jgi:hypothetical protein
MVWRILRKGGVIPLLLILAAVIYWRLYPHPPKILSVGYVADRNLILWSALAQVKQPVADLHYGDRVEVVRTDGSSLQVRGPSGTIGWLLDSRQVMDQQLWGESVSLLARAQTLPVQAVGHTKTVSNVRIEPGRDAKRVYQFTRGTPVVVLERSVAVVPQAAGEEGTPEEKDSADEPEVKKEDWLLVLRTQDASSTAVSPVSNQKRATAVSRASDGHVSGGPNGSQAGLLGGATPAVPIAGWVLARFIELDMPGPVRDIANSANLHVVAWAVLNRVPDGSGSEVPQYVVAGSRGGEGQPCDFTLLRVYTWSVRRKRYETAYIESDLCGRLPIRVSSGERGPEFEFAEADDSLPDRKYGMEQTLVRRLKNDSARASAAQRKTP